MFIRGSVSNKQLLFDPEIERTIWKLNSKTRKRKQLIKRRSQLEGTSTSKSSANPILEATMAELVVPVGPYANSPRRNAHVVRAAKKCKKS